MRQFGYFWVSLLLVAVAALPATGHAAAPGRVVAKHFVSRICPYGIDYPNGWKAKGGGSYDDFYNSEAHVQLTCQKVPSGTSLSKFTNLFAAKLKEKAVITSVRSNSKVGRIDGYYPRRTFGHVVYFILGITMGKGRAFEFQLVTLTRPLLNKYAQTFYHMLDTLR